jgi:hypothetical protein
MGKCKVPVEPEAPARVLLIKALTHTVTWLSDRSPSGVNDSAILSWLGKEFASLSSATSTSTPDLSGSSDPHKGPRFQWSPASLVRTLVDVACWAKQPEDSEAGTTGVQATEEDTLDGSESPSTDSDGVDMLVQVAMGALGILGAGTYPGASPSVTALCVGELLASGIVQHVADTPSMVKARYLLTVLRPEVVHTALCSGHRMQQLRALQGLTAMASQAPPGRSVHASLLAANVLLAAVSQVRCMAGPFRSSESLPLNASYRSHYPHPLVWVVWWYLVVVLGWMWVPSSPFESHLGFRGPVCGHRP